MGTNCAKWFEAVCSTLLIKSAERRAPSAERRAPSAERRAPSAERRAPSAERRAPSDRPPPRRGGHRTFETASAARLPAARPDVPAGHPGPCAHRGSPAESARPWAAIHHFHNPPNCEAPGIARGVQTPCRAGSRPAIA